MTGLSKTIETEFAYLFGEGGFTWTDQSKEPSPAYSYLVAGSKDFQIKFTLEDDNFDVFFCQTSSVMLSKTDDWWCWYSVISLIAFEEARFPERTCAGSVIPRGAALNEQVAAFGRIVEPLLPGFRRVFSGRPEAEWWNSFAAFRRRRIGVLKLAAA